MKRQTLPEQKQYTASVLLVTKEFPKRILLVHHKKFDLWIQPGGHVEEFENPIQAAVREGKEETGIDISKFLEKIQPIDAFASFLPVPDFFLEEKIQAYKDEPEHYHLDMLYKLEVPFQPATKADEESNNIGWFTLDEAITLPMYENTRAIIKKVLQ